MEKLDKLQIKTEELTNENIKKLGSLFPELLTEVEKNGELIKTIDIEKLKEFVGDFAEKDSEVYQLTWAGKQNARREAIGSTTKTLQPVIKDSITFENTKNIYIEGDNLEVLKILRKSYTNSIKAIYIDPPYNTRKDLIYKDNFSMKKEDYEAEARIVDEEGNRMKINNGTDGRYHSNWLNMIYPRLQLAHKLLSKDGIIFISIDHHEIANLIKICDEIFTESNFISIFPRLTVKGGKTQSFFNTNNCDYVIVYGKNIEESKFNKILVENDPSFKYDDEYLKERGKYHTKQALDTSSLGYIASLDYPIEFNGEKYYPGGDSEKNKFRWTWSQKKLKFALDNNFVEFKNGRVWPKKYLNASIEKKGDKYYISYDARTKNYSQLEFLENSFSNTNGTKDLKNLKIEGFDYPKPVNLIKKIIKMSCDKDSTILDFFSGAATTAHAVMQLNAEDKGNRKYIMVQLPEETNENSDAYKAGYKNIAEIGKERIRRAAKKIKEETKSDIDYGFKVFKLTDSIYKDTILHPGKVTQETLQDFAESIKKGTIEESILYTVLLSMGIPLSAKIETKTINNKKVFVISDGLLVMCFDKNIDLELIKELAKIKTSVTKLKPKYVFKESSIKNDSEMMGIMDYLKSQIYKTKEELKENVKVI
jgi:adenine-specific DNA-methyltransferase